MSLFEELKRRNVFRVAVAYLVIGWLVVQVIGVLLPMFDVSAGFQRGVVLLLVVGFLPALFFSWAFELTPDGIKKEAEVNRDKSVVTETGNKLNLITLIGVAGVAGLFVYQQMNPSSSVTVPMSETQVTQAESGQSEPAGNTDIISKITSTITESNSIAVLPFVNMSSDKEQEYFADGISEEILNALVKAKGLRVAGRTSSFSFKGKDETIKQIGEALNVAHVLEGSVRKQGNQVRITAQLIKADDEFHMWSETYDGTLDNIFDLQEKISRQVTEELKILLKLDSGERLANKMTDDIEAYDLFLRGREKVAKRLNDNIPQGIALLNQAVERDPAFAEAWAVLAEAEAVGYGYYEVNKTESEKRAIVHAEQALSINNKLALPHAVLGLLKSDHGDHLQALNELQQALSVEPNNLLVNRWIGILYSRLNRIDLSAQFLEKAYQLDPLSSINAYNQAASKFQAGELEAAIKMFQITGGLRDEIIFETSFIYELQGNNQQAREHFIESYEHYLSRNRLGELLSAEEIDILSKAMFGGTAQDKQAAQALSGMYLKNTDDQFFWQLQLLIAIGNIDRAYEILEDKPEFFDNFAADIMWYPNQEFKAFRADPRFIGLLQKYNFPQTWQAIGWPKACQPNLGTDGSDGQFSCE